MTRIIDSLDQIAADYDTLYCDLWGCVHDGLRFYPAAVAALQRFRRNGGRVALLTNGPRPSSAVVEQLKAMGVPEDAHDVIVSSGDATQHVMLEGVAGYRVWHLGPAKDDTFFTDLPPDAPEGKSVVPVSFEEAEGIICTGLFDDLSETPEDYRAQLAEAAARDLPMLCANPDIVVDLGERRLYCAGALAALYEDLGGRSLYAGKPHAPIYDLARRRLEADGGASVGRVLAIGDGPGTDVEGALANGLDALFVTGGLAQDQFGPDVENPDPHRLDGWLRQRRLEPHYSIGRLR